MSNNPNNPNNPSNPNNPFNLYSQWNPWQSTPPTSNSPMPGFGTPYQAYPSQQPINPDEYNDFMLWRNSQQNPTEVRSVGDEITPTPTPSSSRRKVGKKGKGKQIAEEEPVRTKPKKNYPNLNPWDPEDELRLANSWIAVSEDSNRGNAQTGASFWYLVMQEYNGRNPPYQRTKDALTSKWTKLNADCQKFGGIVSRLKNDWRSGSNDQDFRVRCETQFKVENLRNFNNYLAWDFLKDKQKWLNPDPVVIGRRNKRRETVNLDDVDLDEEPEQAEENPNADLFVDDPVPRPKGKARKSKSQRTSSGSASTRESFENSLTGTFESIRSDKHRYYSSKELETQIRILAIPTDHLPERDRRIIERQKDVIREMLERQSLGGGSDEDY